MLQQNDAFCPPTGQGKLNHTAISFSDIVTELVTLETLLTLESHSYSDLKVTLMTSRSDT